MRRAAAHPPHATGAAPTLPLFGYGTLLDTGLLATVLGRRRELPRLRPALLPRHRCVHVRGAPYPVVVPDAGGAVRGALLEGLRPGDWARLWHYESDDYELLRCHVETAAGARAALLFAGGTTEASREPWTLHAWRLRHRTAALVRIRQHMATYREHSPAARLRPGASKRERSRRSPEGTSKSTQ